MAILAELALFAVLFTDGMRVGWADLRSAWRLPGRALGWGLPLTLVSPRWPAHYVVGLGWPESLLIGAILGPDGSGVRRRRWSATTRCPARLRHLLNVESGVNDGLALPFVIVFLAVAAGSDDLHLGDLALEVLLGIAIGVSCRWARSCWSAPGSSPRRPPTSRSTAVAIGLLVLALGKVTHANLFLAAFAAGITVATFGPRQRAAFEHFGENVAELFKLAALLVFGALISPAFLGEISWPAGSSRSWRHLRRPAGRAVAVVPALRPGHARAGGGDVVRARRASRPWSTGCSCWSPASPPRTRFSISSH